MQLQSNTDRSNFFLIIVPEFLRVKSAFLLQIQICSFVIKHHRVGALKPVQSYAGFSSSKLVHFPVKPLVYFRGFKPLIFPLNKTTDLHGLSLPKRMSKPTVNMTSPSWRPRSLWRCYDAPDAGALGFLHIKSEDFQQMWGLDYTHHFGDYKN